MPISLRAFVSAIVLLCVACGSSTSSPGSNQPALASIAVTPSVQGMKSAAVALAVTPGPLASISIQPASVTMAVGDDDRPLTATALDANQNPIPDAAFDWKSDNTGAATVMPNADPSAAAVHAVAANGEQNATAQITATVGDVHASAAVMVKPTAINSIAITPPTATIHVGATQAFTARAFQDAFAVSGVSFVWKSSKPAVVSVNEKTGVATALAAGDATITASARGINSKPGGQLTVATDVSVSISPSQTSVGMTKAVGLKVTNSNFTKDGSVNWSLTEENGGSLKAGASSAVYTATCRKGTFHVVVTSNEQPAKSATATINVAVPGPGSLDPCFSNGGMVTTTIGSTAAANAIAVQPDGKIVVVGKGGPDAAKPDFAVARYMPDGTPDESFGTKGIALT